MEKSPIILVVDDEPDLLDSLEMTLLADGHQVLKANHGEEALSLLQNHQVDLVLADIAMPHMNGYQLYERVRENPAWVTIPFVFLSARAMDTDIRYGKELGVDDYLIKPIRSAELTAVLRGKLKRSQQLRRSIMKQADQVTLKAGLHQVGALRIDIDRHQVILGEEEIKLSAKEFSMLVYLANQVGKIVSHQELIQITHDLETDPIEAGTLLRPLISSVRHKLRSASPQAKGHHDYIENVRSLGYRLVGPSG